MVFTEPPPPDPSIMRTSGTRYWLAKRSMKMSFSLIVASAGAAAHGEVVAGDRYGTAVDAGPAHDGIGGREVDEIVAAVIFGLAGDAADLPEGAVIDQPVDALAHGQAAAVVLALHLVGAAHALRHFLTPP